MSVIKFSKNEIIQIGKALIQHRKNFETSFFTPAERLVYASLQQDPLKDIETAIWNFVVRLYIANQVAYYYNYPDECEDNMMKIDLLTEEDVENTPDGHFSVYELLYKLGSLRYNLYTNNGRCFLGKEDEERLRIIIERLKDVLKDALIERLRDWLSKKEVKI